ncbi:hypothetical protein PVAP13_1KG508752 [Panicum virgatum]|uniref:Uncharacterized protein n=1 Tax=Panicum virgatum TaxID=38727 RepID=A0A8T0XTG1_PANVG|nr:hypothetical protein PVAP13_1KG508752 [Panicum virgatum]KAG2661527.1 hypothetical protein PVAP13_1KG508752 [Panicum virgatum]
MPYKKYVRAILDMGIKYMSAMRVYDQKWSQNIFTWKAKSADGIVEDKVGCLTGYIVLQYMAAWKHVRTTPICVDGQALRRNFVIDTLAFDGNSYRKILPDCVKKCLSRITGKDI